MAIPFLFIPGAILAALLAYLKLHAIHITVSAASAAVKSYIRSRDADDAANAALRQGASTAASDAVRDFLRFNF